MIDSFDISLDLWSLYFLITITPLILFLFLIAAPQRYQRVRIAFSVLFLLNSFDVKQMPIKKDDLAFELKTSGVHHVVPVGDLPSDLIQNQIRRVNYMFEVLGGG